MLVTSIADIDTTTGTTGENAKGAKFSTKEREGFRRVWDKLQGDEHNLDLARAQLLHKVWQRLDQSDENLTTFIIEVLGEYRGKRCASFVRLVHAFEANSDARLWRAIGGRAMVLLTRAKGADRRKIAVGVRQTMARTQREALSVGTFRTIAQAALGVKGYRKILTETRSGSHGAGVRHQLAVLKGILLKVASVPAVSQALTREAKAILGLDLVQ